MRCPHCDEKVSRVVDSRLSRDGRSIRRRRQCVGCGRRFTTYERREEAEPMVVKKDGRRERFDREKLRAGIIKACQKRPVSMETIEDLLEGVERELTARGEEEFPSGEIGERVMRRLHKIDKVAYVRFASVYREFGDITDFMKEVREMRKS